MDARIALRTSSATVSMSQKAVPHFQDTDPRYLPTYTLSEASHYLLIPIATLRSWVVGRYYPVREGRGFFKPPILVPQKNPIMLSFVNLIEAHVLDAVRREFYVTFPKVRSALTISVESSSPIIPWPNKGLRQMAATSSSEALENSLLHPERANLRCRS